jgi:hypothetical protein
MHSEKNPNPQGKGVVPLLADWQSTRPARVEAKTPAHLLLDWFASMLVLSAEFSFKPVAGQCYYLYLREGNWHLSLISPEEWGERRIGDCLGRCRLRHDMTWQIEADDEPAELSALRAQLATLLEAFLSDLDCDAAAETRLPGYTRNLPYYRRLLATGLGTSLRESLHAAGEATNPARSLLERGGEALLVALANQGQGRLPTGS